MRMPAIGIHENLFWFLLQNGRSKDGALRQMREDMQQGKSGTLYYGLDGKKKIMVYSPLQIEDWYLLAIVPEKVAQEQTISFIRTAIYVAATVAGLFLALTMLVVAMQHKSRKDLEEIAFIDPVTGGFNREKFELEAGREIKARHPAPMYLFRWTSRVLSSSTMPLAARPAIARCAISAACWYRTCAEGNIAGVSWEIPSIFC